MQSFVISPSCLVLCSLTLVTSNQEFIYLSISIIYYFSVLQPRLNTTMYWIYTWRSVLSDCSQRLSVKKSNLLNHAFKNGYFTRVFQCPKTIVHGYHGHIPRIKQLILWNAWTKPRPPWSQMRRCFRSRAHHSSRASCSSLSRLHRHVDCLSPPKHGVAWRSIAYHASALSTKHLCETSFSQEQPLKIDFLNVSSSSDSFPLKCFRTGWTWTHNPVATILIIL